MTTRRALSAVAKVAEAMTAKALAERVPVLRSKGGRRARTVKVVGPDGDVKGVATHGQLLQGLVIRVGIEVAVVDGKRPEWILCVRCGAPRRVPRSGGRCVPDRCAPCIKADRNRRRAMKARLRRQADLRGHRERARRRVGLNRDTVLAQKREYRERHREELAAKERARIAKLRGSPETQTDFLRRRREASARHHAKRRRQP